MRILFINNDGAGFANHTDIESGTTVERLFSQRMSHGRPGDYLIRVNRQPTAADYVLQEGDRVSITPVKIEGAASRLYLSQTKGDRWELDNGSTDCT